MYTLRATKCLVNLGIRLYTDFNGNGIFFFFFFARHIIRPSQLKAADTVH